MQYTSNYQLKKQELTDKADITQISENWDTIDLELATVDGKSGGTVTGDVEINGHLSTEGFNTKLDYIKGQTPAEPKNATWNIFDSENNRVARVQFNISESGVPSIGMYVNKNNDAVSEDSTGVVCQWNDVTPKVSITHNPDNDSNDKQIATTNWVKSQIAATSASKDEIKKIVLDLFFPIGAVYLSADNNFNPNSSWGGNWVKIENRFLLGSGTRGVGATGGEAEHALTVDELPAHTHSGSTSSAGNHSHSRGTIGNDLTGRAGFNQVWRTEVGNDGGCLSWAQDPAEGSYASSGKRSPTAGLRFSGSSGFTGSVSYAGDHSHSMSLNNTGGNRAHNNMPPFEVVNIWRRVA